MPRRVLAAVAAASLLSTIAFAITYGRPDGDGHPNVGGMVAEWREAGRKDLLCSGTLISPTVFLTAAHCTAYLESRGIRDVWVTLDASFTPDSRLYQGTMHTNPDYNPAQDDPGDIAVIVLQQAVHGVPYGSLPTEGVLDTLAERNGLRDQKFTAVGYGVHEPVNGPGGPQFPDTNDRWVAVSEFRALNNAWLRLSQVGATGDGGTCYGDSGGPNFLGAGDGETSIVAAITVTGDAMCRATNVTYRLDKESARRFLRPFVPLP